MGWREKPCPRFRRLRDHPPHDPADHADGRTCALWFVLSINCLKSVDQNDLPDPPHLLCENHFTLPRTANSLVRPPACFTINRFVAIFKCRLFVSLESLFLSVPRSLSAAHSIPRLHELLHRMLSYSEKSKSFHNFLCPSSLSSECDL